MALGPPDPTTLHVNTPCTSPTAYVLMITHLMDKERKWAECALGHLVAEVSLFRPPRLEGNEPAKVKHHLWAPSHHLLSCQHKWMVKGSGDVCRRFRPGFCIHLLCDPKQAPCQPQALFLQLFNGMNGSCPPTVGTKAMVESKALEMTKGQLGSPNHSSYAAESTKNIQGSETGVPWKIWGTCPPKSTWR